MKTHTSYLAPCCYLAVSR